MNISYTTIETDHQADKPKFSRDEIASFLKKSVIPDDAYGKTSYRAIVDIGVLVIQPDYLIPVDDHINITDASSDMLILDVGSNPDGLKVGDMIRFKLKYMGALGLMSSYYIEKKVEE